MEVETGRHAHVLVLAAEKLRRSAPADQDIRDELTVIAARLEGLAERLLDDC